MFIKRGFSFHQPVFYMTSILHDHPRSVNVIIRPAAQAAFRTWSAFLLFLLAFCVSVQVAAAPLAGVTIDKTARSLVAPEGETYEWYYNSEKIPGEHTQKLAVRKAGNYSVKVVTASGEENVQQITVTVLADGTIKKIFLIGDSTVQDYSDGWYPQRGWGQMLPYFFDSEVTIINKAVGGTSSKSFYDNYWPAVLNEVQEGDYVFIQFGHNDYNPNDPSRYTTDATFKQYIQNYVLQTRGKSAFPVLVTPVHRNNWDGEQIRNGWRNYPNNMREVAAQMNVPLIDLHNRSEVLLESVGRAYGERHIFLYLKAGEYPRSPLDASNLNDGVHFQEMGAVDLAKLIVEGIKALPERTEMAELVPHLKPTYELTVTSNTTQSISATRSASFPAGTPITLKVTRPEGYSFAGWTTSDGSLADIKMNHSFTMPAQPVSYQANFTLQENAPLVAGATYRIEARHSQLFLDIHNLWRTAGSLTANNTGIVQYPYTGNLSQQWILNDVGDGYYTLTSVASNKSMDVQGRAISDGTNVVQYTTGTSTSTNQHFRLVPTEGGYYKLMARHSSKCLQIADASTGYGVQLKQQACSDATSQQFSFHRVTAANTLTNSPEEEALATELQVYPNPSNTAFKISTTFKFNYLVYDDLGKVHEKGEGFKQKEIGATLKPGMYFLKVQNGQNFRFVKLLKQ